MNLKNLEIPSPKFKDILGIKLAYRDIGEGPVVFCLPPWPSGSIAFAPFASLIKNDFRIIALDLPGWGGNSGKMKLNPTVDNYAAIIEEFIKSFEIEDFSLLGYSFGGALAQKVSDRGIVSPKKIVLISTMHSGDEIYRKFKVFFKLYLRVLALHLPNYIIKLYLRRFMFSLRKKTKYYKLHKTSEFYKRLISESKKADNFCTLHSLFSLFDMELLDPTDKLKKTLILVGDTDSSFVQSESKQMGKYLGIEPVIIENADHDHFCFDPEKSVAAIVRFLEK